MRFPPPEWQPPAAVPLDASSDCAPALAVAVRLGLRFYQKLLIAGALPVQPVPSEIMAMHGALQIYERDLRRSRVARVVPRRPGG